MCIKEVASGIVQEPADHMEGVELKLHEDVEGHSICCDDTWKKLSDEDLLSRFYSEPELFVPRVREGSVWTQRYFVVVFYIKKKAIWILEGKTPDGTEICIAEWEPSTIIAILEVKMWVAWCTKSDVDLENWTPNIQSFIQ